MVAHHPVKVKEGDRNPYGPPFYTGSFKPNVGG